MNKLAAALLALLAPVFALSVHAQQADLVINQSDSPDPGPAGGVFTYQVRVDNNGPNTATSVVLSNTIPPGSTFIDATPTQGSCSGPAGGTLTCNLGTLNFTSSATVTVRVILPTPGVFTNTATATSAVADPNADNNTDVPEGTTAQNAANMTLTVVDAPDPVAAGEPYSYSVTAVNNGPTTAGTQQVAFNVPTGACVTALPSGGFWVCTAPGSAPYCSGQLITCNRNGLLNPGASAGVITVPAVSNVGGTVTASFAVSSNLPDGDPTDNTISESTTSAGGSADLQVTKAASPVSVAVGANVTFTLTARRNGGVQPTGIQVTDNLPAGFTYQSGAGTGWTCPAGPIPGPAAITCSRATYAGANFTNMPAITITATATGGGLVTNSAEITADQADPVPGNNTSSVNVTISNEADLSLTKTASLNPVTVGQAFNYSLVVRNNGPVAIAGSPHSVTDTIEAGLTLRGLPSGSGWTCSIDPPALPVFPLAGPASFTCSRSGATLGVNANAPAIAVPVEANTSGAFNNTACVALGGTGPTDPNAANDCSSVGGTATSMAASADLQVVSKVASPDPVNSGDVLTYTITVTNNGPGAVPDAVVTDALGSLRSTAALPGLVSATSTQGACTPAGPLNTTSTTVTCNVGALAVGQTETITIRVRPAIATTGNRGNTATINSATIGDPDRTNNSIAINSVVNAVADVSVTKTDTPDPAQAGTPLVYTIVARATNGFSHAQNVVVNDVMPGNVVFLSLGAVSGGGSCSSIPTPGSIGETLTCSWPTINANTQQTVTYTVRPVTGAVSVANDVDVTTSTIETNTANNSASSTTAITPAAVDLIINKVDDVDPVALGSTVRYTIRVENAGPSHATNVVMTDTFPAPAPPASPTTATFSYQGGLATSPNPAGLTVSCVEPALDATAGALTCTIPELPVGGVVLIEYDMRADAIAGTVSGTIFNHAAITANETETLAANNQTTHSTTARLPTDLGVTKTVLTAPVNQGGTIDFRLFVENHGPNNSDGAVLTDTLPAGITFDSVVSTAGNGTCGFAAPTLTCTLGLLSAGDTFEVVFRADVPAPYTGANPLPNTASIATVNEIDTNPANNTDSTSTPIVVANLTVGKTFGAASYTPGAAGTWTIVVGNTGPDTASDVSVADTLPAGVTLTGPWTCVASGAAACPASGGVAGDAAIALAGATVPAGQTLTITLPVVFDAGMAANPVVNTVNVTGTASPPVTANSPVPRLASVGLAVTKTDGSLTYTPGGTATYTVVVTNGGPSNAADVTVTDNLPAGVVLTAGVTCTPLGTATCGTVTGANGDTAWGTTSATIAAGAGNSLTFTAPVAFAPGLLTNPLVNQVDVTDVPSGAAVSATDSDTLAFDVTLSVTKTDGSATYTPGSTATYTVTVTNTGLSTATNATVSDTFPAGVTSTALVTCSASGTSVCGTMTSAVGATAFTDVGAEIDPGPGNAITYTVPVAYAPGMTADPITNTADVNDIPSGATGSGSDSDTLAFDVTLVVAKTDGVAAYTPGGTATYTITVENTGLSDALSVTVADTFPAGVTLSAGATCVPAGAATCGTVTGAAGDTGFGATGATLPAGGGNTLTFTVPVAFAPAMTDDPLINTVTATDVPSGSNASAQDSDTLAADANLVVTKTDGAATYSPGGTATYTIVVTNTGISTANDITVDDPLPAGVTLAATPTCMAAGTASCGTVVGTVGGSVFGALSATLDPGVGNSLTYTVPVAFDASMTTSPLVNTVTVSDPGSPTSDASDSNLLEIGLAKSILPASIPAGGTATLTLTLGNGNAVPATLTAAFTDPMPASVTTASGNTGTCPGVTVDPTLITMAAGSDIPPGGCTIVVEITSATPGNYTNTTSPLVTSVSSAPPASAPLTVVALVGSGLTKAIAPAVIAAGGSASMTITLGNPNPLAVSLTSAFTDPMPAGVTTATANTGTCAGVTVDPTLVTVAAGTSIPPGGCTIVVGLTSAVPGAYVNTTSSLETTGGTTPSASAPLTVTTIGGPPNPDLAITKTPVGTFSRGQVGAQYTIVVANVGGVPSLGTVTVEDSMPGGISATGIAGAGWTCTQPAGPCSRADVLGPGDSYPTITLTVNVGATPPLNIVNVVSVTGGGDPNPTNNSSSAPVSFAPGDPLAVPLDSPWMLVSLSLLLLGAGAAWQRRTGRR